LILEFPELSRVGFKPSYFTTRLFPLKKDIIVLFPTPVSPITKTDCGFSLSIGMA
jgi:hypothetical protein